MRGALVVTSAVALSAIAAAACGGSDTKPACLVAPASTANEPSPTGLDSFQAFAQHFAGFHAFPAYPARTNRATDAFHGDVTFTAYVNRVPAAGAGEFPVGTVIVKEQNDGDRDQRTVFAMVKRGGGFNPSGGGWEWFELQESCTSDDPVIAWRGVGPPAGEKYGGDPNGCNTCHSAAADNDFVYSDALSLSALH